MELSYWERKSWFNGLDFTVVGSGIVGLNCALSLAERYPKAKILILEKGPLPQGGSTKNAGFACFGSLSEILADLKKDSETAVVELVSRRKKGIDLLRSQLGDSQLGYEQHGGHEIFTEETSAQLEECLEEMDRVNKLLLPVFGRNPFKKNPNLFQFQAISDTYITHLEEGQLDTGKMMMGLLRMVRSKGIEILNGVSVKSWEDSGTSVQVDCNLGSLSTANLMIATNGFASSMFDVELKPARAQVLVTRPIKNLTLKGTFHMDEGFYYFRNIDNRVLLGGGRNLDFEGETTTQFGTTKMIQEHLESLLHNHILPDIPFEIENRWSGIMGVGETKTPVVEPLSGRVFCGVKLGGMGVAIGSQVGRELAELAD